MPPLKKIDEDEVKQKLRDRKKNIADVDPGDSNFKKKYGDPEDVKFGQCEGNTTKDVLENDPSYILWVVENFDDPSDCIEPEIEQMREMADEAERRLQNREESEHVGKKGEREKFAVKVEKSIAYENKGKRKRVVVMRDKNNNRITTFLRRSSKTARELDRAAPKRSNRNLTIEAEVAKHKEYEGENDTVVANPEVVHQGIGDLERESPPKGTSFREQRLNAAVDEFFETWKPTFLRRVKKFSKVRRALKKKPFTDETTERLESAFQTLLETHESRKETVKDLQNNGYGTVQGDFDL